MATTSRWSLAAVGLCLFGGLLAAPPADPPHVTVYDPDPAHLWNRLHDALYVRLDGQGPDDPGELDAYLWQRHPYREKGEPYQRAVKVLDEFITARGDRLITDPRKRALLQRDLWVLFDTAARERPTVVPDAGAAADLARRVAQILPRLALTADQIKGLPDNFAEAVAARVFPNWMEAGRLWSDDGPWVLLGAEDQQPVARTHVEFFGGRSAFFVFLRLAEGRAQTLKYVTQLRTNGTAPKLDGGAAFALVRQLQLFDDHGRILLTPITESVQVRGFGNHKFKLNRQALADGKPSLVALGEADRERAFLTLLGRNTGAARIPVLATCAQCHPPDTLESYTRLFSGPPTFRPGLTASTRVEEELRARWWKARSYEWGLLHGLQLARPAE
jgi:hypothetical protein